MKKKKILYIINDGMLGGGQIHIAQLLEGLDSNKYIPHIACQPVGKMYPVFEMLTQAFQSIWINRGWTLPALFRNISSVFVLHQTIRKECIDIVHTHGGIAGLWGRLAALLCRSVHIVHTLHGIHYLHYQNPFIKYLFIFIERILGRFTNKVICVSHTDRRTGLKHSLFSCQQSVVIQNGVDMERVCPLDVRKEFGFHRKVQLIVHVARLHHQKGQTYLLTALKYLIRQLPDTRLLMIGDGPLKGTLMSLSQKLALNDHVLFLGSRQDARKLVSGCDLFVLPSLWEGLPLAALEAMVLGMPIVATAVEGISECIRDGVEGILVSPKDPSALAEAMVKLLQNRSLARKLGKQGQIRVHRDFNVDRMVDETEHVYASVGV